MGGLHPSSGHLKQSEGWPSREGTCPICLELRCHFFPALGLKLRDWFFLGLEPAGLLTGPDTAAHSALRPEDLGLALLSGCPVSRWPSTDIAVSLLLPPLFLSLWYRHVDR